MLFNSLAFVLLLATSRGLAFATPWPAMMLIAASVVFYAVAGPFDSAVFFGTVCINWLIQLANLPGRWRIAVAAMVNVGLIFFFKYKGLLLGGNATGSYVDTALPLGISFYCFQALAYHVDVVKGHSPPASSFRSFLLFKSFFPQLIAGPIVRAPQFLPQIERLFAGTARRHRLLSFGLALCVLGLVKKVMLADSIGPLADEIFAAMPDSAYQAWLGAVLFTFQIYYDFSGYSDIAIGAAYLLGMRLPINFRTPYVSCGPREFWQRWHISLSTWIRDYLYIPLGGSRGSWLRGAVVLVGTMAVAGLWHGANYTFILWGAGWGLYILAGRMLSPALPLPLRWAAHMVVVVVLWVLFRSPGVGFALDYLGVMLSFHGWQAPAEAAPQWLVACGVAGLFLLHALEYRLHDRASLVRLRRWNRPFGLGVLLGLALLLVLMPAGSANPCIYFRV